MNTPHKARTKASEAGTKVTGTIKALYPFGYRDFLLNEKAARLFELLILADFCLFFDFRIGIVTGSRFSCICISFGCLLGESEGCAVV